VRFLFQKRIPERASFFNKSLKFLTYLFEKALIPKTKTNRFINKIDGFCLQIQFSTIYDETQL